MRRPALIFDFGNVIGFFDYGRAAASLGLDPGAVLRRARDAGLAPLLQRYEVGQIGCDDFARGFCALAGLEVEPDAFRAAWADIFWPNEPVAALVSALKRRGYTLVLGSNTNALHSSQFRRQFAATLAHFDRLVLSHEVGQAKPSAGFFEACASAAGVPPGDCIFIDDLEENVDGARRAGMRGLVFRDAEQLAGSLRGLGVEVA